MHVYRCCEPSSRSDFHSVHLYEYVGQVVMFWLSRDIGCPMRDIHDFLTCSCSANIGKP